MPAAIALRARLQPTRLALQYHHVIDEFHRYPEPQRPPRGVNALPPQMQQRAPEAP